MINIILFLLIVIFNILDVYQTNMLINLGVSEGSPIINYLSSKFGFLPAIIGFKTITLTLLGVCLYKLHLRNKEREREEFYNFWKI